MKITHEDRKKLVFYLTNFYNRFPQERFTILHFVKYFKKRLKDNKDAWIGVSGDTGSGKSLFVIMAMILFGRPMDLTKNIAYIPKGSQIMEMFDKLNFQTLLIDEAAREMRAVNWQSRAQQGVNVKAMTDRFKNNMVFLNMPNFNEFTKSMKVSNIKFRALVLYRTETYARIVIQRKDRNWRSEDPWHDAFANAQYQRMQKRRKEISNDIILKIERSLPNTVMDFIIPNLEVILPHVTKEYDRLKMESRKSEDNEDLNPRSQRNKYREQYTDLLRKVTKVLFYNQLDIGKVRVSREEMAKSLGLSKQTFNKYLKEEVMTEKEKQKLIHKAQFK